MKYNENVCSFTGYRPQKLPFGSDENSDGCIRLKKAIADEILFLSDNGYERFQSGMASGTDLICAELVLELKKEAPRISLSAVIPCLEQEKNFSEFEQNRYRKILEQADEVVYVNKTLYFDGCMWLRNKYLVDTCDRLIAVYDGKKGGTMQTVSYARKCGKKITVLDPYSLHRVEIIDGKEQLENQEYFRRFYD